MTPQLVVQRRRRRVSANSQRKPRQLKKRRHRKSHINRKHRSVAKSIAQAKADKRRMKTVRGFIGHSHRRRKY